MQLKVGNPIEVLDIKTPVVENKDFYLVKELFEKYPDLFAFLLRDHGMVALGDNVLNAEHNAELIEETAMIAVLKRLMS